MTPEEAILVEPTDKDVEDAIGRLVGFDQLTVKRLAYQLEATRRQLESLQGQSHD